MNNTRLKSIMLAGGIVAALAAGVFSFHGSADGAPPPRVRVHGPAMHAFAGGDYWVMRMAARRELLRDSGGAIVPPDTYTEEQWAAVRAGTTYLSGWGFKFRFSAPDRRSGAGTATVVVDGTEHRHRVDQTYCTDCGLHPGGALGMRADYTLARDGRLSFSYTDPTGTNVAQGAFSRDFNMFAVVVTGGPDMGKDVIVGVKVATAPLTLSGLFAQMGYDADLGYRFDAATPDPNDILPVGSQLGIGAGIGWADVGGAAGGLEFTSHLDVADPATTSAVGTAATFSHPGGPALSSITTGPDGVFTYTGEGGFWLAASPDAQLAIAAGDLNDVEPRFTTLELQRHHTGNGVILAQDPARRYAVDDLRGSYALVGRFDDLRILAPLPATDCHAGPEVVSGSIYCGTGPRQTLGTSNGVLTVGARGEASYSGIDYHDTETTGISSGTAILTVERRCFGVDPASPTGRKAYNDPACDGGRMLDVGVLRDAGGEIAMLLIGDGGDVLAFFDGKSIEPVAGRAGMSRSLGYALRLR